VRSPPRSGPPHRRRSRRRPRPRPPRRTRTCPPRSGRPWRPPRSGPPPGPGRRPRRCVPGRAAGSGRTRGAWSCGPRRTAHTSCSCGARSATGGPPRAAWTRWAGPSTTSPAS
jgi:hypothetical protein